MDALVKKPWAGVESYLYGLFMSGAIREYQMIGSTYTLGHGRDIDYAVLVNTDAPSTPITSPQPEWLLGTWVREGADHYEGDTFTSYRQGDINIIVMDDLDVYSRFKTAMEVCKVLKLKTRKERVMVCRIVRDHMTAEGAESITVPGEQT